MKVFFDEDFICIYLVFSEDFAALLKTKRKTRNIQKLTNIFLLLVKGWPFLQVLVFKCVTSAFS